MGTPKIAPAQVVLLVENRAQATILAALRHYQHALTVNQKGLSEFLEIATDSGAVLPLSTDDIDALCESVNFGTPLEQVQDYIAWTPPPEDSIYSLGRADEQLRLAHGPRS